MRDENDTAMDIPAELRQWREAKGWTRKQAAAHFGVSVRSIENWEAGVRKPRALKLLDALWGTRRTR